MNTRCDLCEYWEESEDFQDGSAIGWCHRYPPTIVFTDEVEAYRHIETWNNGWCGEFKDIVPSKKEKVSQ